MADRGKEIEAFYWLIMRLLGMAFGYLMMIGGGLFALTFLVERLRTGAIAFGGEVHADGAAVVRLVLLPALVAVGGWALVRWVSRRKSLASR